MCLFDFSSKKKVWDLIIKFKVLFKSFQNLPSKDISLPFLNVEVWKSKLILHVSPFVW